MINVIKLQEQILGGMSANEEIHKCSSAYFHSTFSVAQEETVSSAVSNTTVMKDFLALSNNTQLRPVS
jgi:hypothetical protein